MNTWNKLALLGGDSRQRWAAERLASRGAEVAVWGIGGQLPTDTGIVRTADWQGAVRGAKAILLPIPVSEDGIRITAEKDANESSTVRLTHLLEAAKPDQPIFGGRFPPSCKTAAAERGLRLIDYSTDELFQIRNARPTAEGALEIAMRELPVVLDRLPTAVIGYGRIGRVLADMLGALGASVTVAARKASDLAWASMHGFSALPIFASAHDSSLCRLGRECRVIFNTVPHWLFTRTVLEALSPDVLLIDLASSPGGVDPQTAQACGTRVIRALSLPGKCAPETAGEIIADTVLELLQKEGVMLS